MGLRFYGQVRIGKWKLGKTPGIACSNLTDAWFCCRWICEAKAGGVIAEQWSEALNVWWD